jgi:phage/plasmid-associated DNA primase
MTTENNLFKIYPLKNYKVNNKFIESGFEEYEFEELTEIIEKNDCGYHTRVHKHVDYIFFGDLDGYPEEFNIFCQKLKIFLIKYNIKISKKDIMYTQNCYKNGSYHFTIPKLYCSCEKLHEIFTNLQNYIENDLKINEKIKKNMDSHTIDTTIYSEHWFRLPNQSKESNKNTTHTIITGKMKDFIVEYIPENSINIENKQYYNNQKENNINITLPNKKKNKKEFGVSEKFKDSKSKETKKFKDSKSIETEENLTNVCNFTNKIEGRKHQHIYLQLKKLFDNCYKQFRFDNYNEWIIVGMALKNIFDMDAFDLFDYYSSKSTKYEGTIKTLKKYTSFYYDNKKGIGLGTIYKNAKLDNFEEYKKIMYTKNVTFKQNDFAEKIYELAGNKFLYKKVGDGTYQIYCFNGKYWETDDIALRKFISNELFEYYKNLLSDIYWESENFNKLKNQIDSLKTLSAKKDIIELYKEYGIKNIEFDEKWWLLGFNNLVFDFNSHTFREYQIDDYVSITTGYDWREPIDTELETIDNIINKIMPIEDERKLYKLLLSSSLEGRCLEKFIVFNGGGRNGKGLIDDMLLIALGKYAITANNSLLFEKNKTGSNPEKANLHKKRLILFKEPSEKNKFENSIIKELTGGGKFSARGHHETQTEKKLHSTTICECNKRPPLAEEPQQAELERFIDLHFRSTFTTDKEMIDVENYIFQADIKFKDSNFQEQHKYALLKVLMEIHKEFDPNNIILPDYIKKRTNSYLELSCALLQWFLDNYKLTKKMMTLLKLMNYLITLKITNIMKL